MNERGRQFFTEMERTAMDGSTAIALTAKFARLSTQEMVAASDDELRRYLLAAYGALEGIRLFINAMSADACHRFAIDLTDALTRGDPVAAIYSNSRTNASPRTEPNS